MTSSSIPVRATARAGPGWAAAARRLPRLRTLLRHSDLGLVYAAVLLATSAYVFTRSDVVSARIVVGSSTNLANLRQQPFEVLFLSAFLLSSPWSLWILPPLVVALGLAQRWVGRTATVLVALFGHVFATVLVAVLLSAGLAQHLLDRSIVREPDVGVSYALAAVWGLLLFRLRPRWRVAVGLGVTAALGGLLGASETFTDLGHLVAWGIGVGLGLVGTRIAVAAVRRERAASGP